MIPTCEVVEMELVSMIAGSVKIEVDNTDDGTIGDGFTQDANRHRGEWGNLWN